MEEQNQLVLEILEWLSQITSLAEIEEYVHKVPPEKSWLLSQVVISGTGRLMTQKERKLMLLDPSREIALQITEAEQLNLIYNLARYNAKSVLTKLQTRIGDLDGIIYPQDLSSWAQTYIQQWNAILYCGTAFEYMERKVLANSLVTILQRKLELLEPLLIAVRDHALLENVSVVRDKFLEEMEKTGIFPHEYILSLREDGVNTESVQLAARMADILGLINELGLSSVLQAKEKFLKSVWSQIRSELELIVLKKAESKRQLKLQEGKKILLITEKLITIWNESNILTNQSEKVMTEYIQRLEPEKKQSFAEIFEGFLRQCFVVNFILDSVNGADLFLSLGDYAESDLVYLIDVLSTSIESNEQKRLISLVVPQLYHIYLLLNSVERNAK